MRSRVWRALFLMTCFLIPCFALAQGGGGFTPTKEPAYQGVRATADLPASQHHRNTGGRDGAGLCVYTSAWHAAIWQSVSDVYGFRDWMTKKPGGSYPEKFDQTLAQYCQEKKLPLPGYVQHTGGDAAFLRLALKTGRMVCVTYCGVDDFYGPEVIGHMVNLLYLDDARACILDNNRPGTFLWMSAADFLGRWRGTKPDGSPYMARSGLRWMPIGGGWAIVWLNSPPPPYPAPPPVQTVACCPCGQGCACAAGQCPENCPEAPGAELVQFRRQRAASPCENGQCQLAPSTPPLAVLPAVAPPESRELVGPLEVEDLPNPSRPMTAADVAARPPGEGWLWKDVPGLGVRWIMVQPAHLWGRRADNTWGWVPRPKKARAVEAAAPEDRQPAPAPREKIGGDPFPGGVIHDKLFADESYSISGKPATKADAHAVLLAGGAALSDDTSKWNVAVVGDTTFCKAVWGDVQKLPPELRDKIHVQCYAPDSWQAAQFALDGGVTLRHPAVGRVGPNAGLCAPGSYSAAKLVELLAPVSGVTPQPMPGPAPGPGPIPPAPVPEPRKPDPQPPGPDPQPAPPAPAPSNSPLWLVLLAGLLYIVFRRKPQ